MSLASKITLGTTFIGAAGLIAFVHYSQKVEQAVGPAAEHDIYNQN
jgi:hypothetical protein